jgi:hypothetical protein
MILREDLAGLVEKWRKELQENCNCLRCILIEEHIEELDELSTLLSQHAAEQPKLTERLDVLQKALQRISQGQLNTPFAICNCTHDDENCCEKVGEWCPQCIAAAALLTAPVAPPPRRKPQIGARKKYGRRGLSTLRRNWPPSGSGRWRKRRRKLRRVTFADLAREICGFA